MALCFLPVFIQYVRRVYIFIYIIFMRVLSVHGEVLSGKQTCQHHAGRVMKPLATSCREFIVEQQSALLGRNK